MQLVILAAGHGRRFGGLKQLAPIGPNGEAIMDYTARSAESCGFDGLVVVAREEIREEILRHIRRAWSVDIRIDVVCQPPLPGTAQAVLSALPAVTGPFAVANADDLYGEAALSEIVEHFSTPLASRPEAHLLVAYRLKRTVLTAETVTRGICDVGADGLLERIVEHHVTMREDGSFEAVPLARTDPTNGGVLQSHSPRELSGDERVSMNLWGFHRRMLDHLAEAVEAFDPARSVRPELLLPDVVGNLVSSGADEVAVVNTEARCIGVTHREDIALVHAELTLDASDGAPLRLAKGS